MCCGSFHPPAKEGTAHSPCLKSAFCSPVRSTPLAGSGCWCSEPKSQKTPSRGMMGLPRAGWSLSRALSARATRARLAPRGSVLLGQPRVGERGDGIAALHHVGGDQREGREGGEAAEHAGAQQQPPRLAPHADACEDAGQHPHHEAANDIDGQRAGGPAGTEGGQRRLSGEKAGARTDRAARHDEEEGIHRASLPAFAAEGN